MESGHGRRGGWAVTGRDGGERAMGPGEAL